MMARMDTNEDAVKATGSTVARHKRERQDHVAAIVKALLDGERPTDVASWSPFTATYVRKLARRAGVPQAPKGGRRQPHADS